MVVLRTFFGDWSDRRCFGMWLGRYCLHVECRGPDFDGSGLDDRGSGDKRWRSGSRGPEAAAVRAVCSGGVVDCSGIGGGIDRGGGVCPTWRPDFHQGVAVDGCRFYGDCGPDGPMGNSVCAFWGSMRLVHGFFVVFR